MDDGLFLIYKRGEQYAILQIQCTEKFIFHLTAEVEMPLVPIAPIE